MASIMVHANLDGMYSFIGGGNGIINAIESPGFKGDFTDHVLNDLKRKFTTHAIASAGSSSLKHVFEWGPQANGVSTGEPGSIPLFRLTKNGKGGIKQLSYYFVPSTTPVPLPDPAKYGFKADKLEHMTRHIFKYKAIMMESGANVTVHAKWSNRGLFIPTGVTPNTPYGYVMSKKTYTPNPGGKDATGGFSQFWVAWFEGEAPFIVKEHSKLMEQFIGKISRKVFRDAKGQFASGKSVGISYVASAERTAELVVKTAAKRYLSDGPVEDWDGGE